MARRKKEPKIVHREKIASAASALFMNKGIAATSMDDIAKAAGYRQYFGFNVSCIEGAGI